MASERKRGQAIAFASLSFWVEPQALAAFLVAVHGIAASAGASVSPQFLAWMMHHPCIKP